MARRTSEVLALAALFAAGCGGSVSALSGAAPAETATTAGGGGAGGGGAGGGAGAPGAGGAPAASCADAPVLWSVATETPWQAMAVAPDGSTFLYGSGSLAKIDAGGMLLWQAAIEPANAYRLAAGPGGRVLLGPSADAPTYRAYLAGDDESPTLLWSEDAEDLGLAEGIWSTRAAVTADGQFVIAGTGDGSLSLVALGDRAEVLWTAAEATSAGYGYAIAAADGEGVVTFQAESPAVARWSSNGALKWSTTYDPGTAGVDDLAVAPGGDSYLLGVTDYPSGTPFSIGRVSAQGDVRWTTPFASNADESLSCGVAPLPDGGAMACVAFEHGGMGVQRVSPDGAALWVPTDWFEPDCGAAGAAQQIAASPDGAVVMRTESGVAKIVP